MKILYIFILLLCLYILAVLYLYLTQDSKIFNFSLVKKEKNRVFNECGNCKEIKFKVKGAVLDGALKEENSSTIVIYFGGNADDAISFLELIKELKVDAVTFNYRGNALSSGTPSEERLFEDALSIYDKFAKNKDVIIIGRSLGSGVAVYLASKREAKKLLLITPYDSIENLAKQKYPLFPISLLLKHKFNSLEYIKDVKAPVGIFVVKKDKTVPNKNTKNLEKNIKNLLFEKVFYNTTHADILSDEAFQRELKKAILNKAYAFSNKKD